MAYRIVKINNRCKLETQLNYLVCRSDKETRILLDEISILVIENQQVCVTTALLSELMNHKVRVMFCDNKHNPQGELQPYEACYDCHDKLENQMSWTTEAKNAVWTRIIKSKIENQAKVLKICGCQDVADKLIDYRSEVDLGDTKNREGLAAKAYFAALFGTDFDRRSKKDIRNTYLNYGYSLILSAINREISIYGYLNQSGIHHIGSTNPFNLGCDFVEPFRPFVDFTIVKNRLIEETYKTEMLNVLNMEIFCNNKRMLIQNAVHDYVLSLLSALNSGQSDEVCEVSFLYER